MILVYNGLSRLCVNDNKCDWGWFWGLKVYADKGLQYKLLLLRFFYAFKVFFWKSKNVTSYIICFASHVFSNYEAGDKLIVNNNNISYITNDATGLDNGSRKLSGWAAMKVPR